MCGCAYTHTHTDKHIDTSDQILCSVTRMNFMCRSFDRIGTPLACHMIGTRQRV